jgi:hypothetical protein
MNPTLIYTACSNALGTPTGMPAAATPALAQAKTLPLAERCTP